MNAKRKRRQPDTDRRSIIIPAALVVAIFVMVLVIGPTAVAGLKTSSLSDKSITFTWTAAGDDGQTGRASQYDIRYSTIPLSDQNWDQADQVNDEPLPQAAGAIESYTLQNLDPATTYYIALRVADEVPNWSAMSNVLEVTTPDDSVTLEIINVQILNITDTSAQVVWYTNEPGTSQLYFGPTTALGFSTPMDSNLSTVHSVSLTGLIPETACYVRAASRDIRGREVQSSYYQFNTTEPVAPPAAINDLMAVSGQDNGEIDLSWTVPAHVASYMIGYSTEIIDISNWDAVTLCESPPLPVDSGTVQTCTLADLELGELYFVAVVSVRANGAMSALSNVDTAVAKFSIIAGVDDEEEGLPDGFELSQNYPNPFNPSTTIEFSIPESVPVRLTVFNTLGQVIRILVDDELAAGQHVVVWDGSDEQHDLVASGMYLYRIEAGTRTETRKMILTK